MIIIKCRARDYDSRIGRWTTKDPAGFKGGMNGYAYVNGNPMTLIDPSGLWAVQGSFGVSGFFLWNGFNIDLIGLSVARNDKTGEYSWDVYSGGGLKVGFGLSAGIGGSFTVTPDAQDVKQLSSPSLAVGVDTPFPFSGALGTTKIDGVSVPQITIGIGRGVGAAGYGQFSGNSSWHWPLFKITPNKK